MIDIYYAKVCGLCHKALDHFKSEGLDFCAYAIEYDKEADAFVDSPNTRAMYERCGEEVDFVPQMFVNGVHIAGWKKLEPMIESGEFQQLLQQD